jgi:hypothetical protein
MRSKADHAEMGCLSHNTMLHSLRSSNKHIPAEHWATVVRHFIVSDVLVGFMRNKGKEKIVIIAGWTHALPACSNST